MAKITEFEQVMMNRDDKSREEAKRERHEAKAALYDILENGGSYDDVEDMLAGDYGLEMDYIFDLL